MRKAVLERVQPYQGTDRARALAAVDRRKIDKHRVVHGGFGAISLAGVRIRPRAIVEEQ